MSGGERVGGPVRLGQLEPFSDRWGRTSRGSNRYRTARRPAQPLQSGACPLIAPTDQLWPAAAVDEQVHQPPATTQPGIGGVDDRQRVTELALCASRELHVIGLLQLPAGQHNPHRFSVPSGDVVRRQALGEHEVEAENMIEGTAVEHRLDRQQLHDAAVDVQVTAHLDSFDERRQRDRDPHHASERNIRRRMRAEILDQSEIGVVDDRLQRDRKLADGEAAEPTVEQALDRLALHHAREPAQRGQHEARKTQPLRIQVAITATAAPPPPDTTTATRFPTIARAGRLRNGGKTSLEGWRRRSISGSGSRARRACRSNSRSTELRNRCPTRSRRSNPCLATTHAGDADTPERLARFDTQGQRVLSVYINLDPSRFPTPHATTASGWATTVRSPRSCAGKVTAI